VLVSEGAGVNLSAESWMGNGMGLPRGGMEREVECTGEGWSWRLEYWLISARQSPTDVPLAPARSKDDPMQLCGHPAGA